MGGEELGDLGDSVPAAQNLRLTHLPQPSWGAHHVHKGSEPATADRLAARRRRPCGRADLPLTPSVRCPACGAIHGSLESMTSAGPAGTLAPRGRTVPRLGFGTMRLTGRGIFGKPADPEACVRTG